MNAFLSQTKPCGLPEIERARACRCIFWRPDCYIYRIHSYTAEQRATGDGEIPSTHRELPFAKARRPVQAKENNKVEPKINTLKFSKQFNRMHARRYNDTTWPSRTDLDGFGMSGGRYGGRWYNVVFVVVVLDCRSVHKKHNTHLELNRQEGFRRPFPWWDRLQHPKNENAHAHSIIGIRWDRYGRVE